jgi:hypothetical protein
LEVIMPHIHPAGSEQSSDEVAHPELSGAGLFTLLWESLADILGTAATAALLRRAARRAVPRSPELAELAIARDNLEYRYTLPPAWNDREEGTLRALRVLVDELRPLLVEMTGQVVVRHLERIPELRERGILSPQGDQK